jgi:hypothetical protein
LAWGGRFRLSRCRSFLAKKHVAHRRSRLRRALGCRLRFGLDFGLGDRDLCLVARSWLLGFIGSCRFLDLEVGAVRLGRLGCFLDAGAER